MVKKTNTNTIFLRESTKLITVFILTPQLIFNIYKVGILIKCFICLDLTCQENLPHYKLSIKCQNVNIRSQKIFHGNHNK